MGRENEAARSLQDRFGFTVRYLHHDCFYNGHCEPLEDTMRMRKRWQICNSDRDAA